MLTLLYEEDLDRAYHAEIADELAERRSGLEQAIEDCETIREQLEAEDRTPHLLADWNLRLIGLRKELARLEVSG